MVVEHSTHDAAGDNEDTGAADMPAQQSQRRRQPVATVTTVPPDTPGSSLAGYDWPDFEQRYLEALREADGREQQIIEEFDQLVEVRTSTYLNRQLVTGSTDLIKVLCCLGCGLVCTR